MRQMVDNEGEAEYEKQLLSETKSTESGTGNHTKSKSSSEKTNYVTFDHKQRQDGPWSIAVAFASFIAQGLLGGYCYTGGIFYTIFRHEFPDVGTVAISWLCTLPLTLFFTGSPIGSMITNKFGCRVCSLIGGLMGSAGLFLCYFANEFYLVFLLYGILAGLGNGIHYVGFITAVGRYFTKYRPIANILTTIGLTFGIAIYSFLVPFLNRHYTLNETLLILGGVSLNVCVCACLLFPLESTVQKSIFNIRILKRKRFLLFCFQCLFCNLSNGMAFLHLPAKILSIDLSSNVVSLSLTLYGVCNCTAKIMLSICGHVGRCDVIIVYTISLTLCGISTVLLPVLSNMFWILCIVGFIGLTYSVCGGHYLEVILTLAGQENFSDGLGIAQIMKAGGTLIAGPLAGVLFKQTLNYDPTFYVSGSAMLIGCLLMVPIILQKHCTSSTKSATVIVVHNEPT